MFYFNIYENVVIIWLSLSQHYISFKTFHEDSSSLATSKTWTRTLKKLDPEKPRPWKTWTQKNLDPKKPGPWKTGSIKTWTLCLELKVWVSSFLNIRGSRLEVFLKFLQYSLKNIKNIREAVFNLKFQAKRSTTSLKRDSGICAFLRISQKF